MSPNGTVPLDFWAHVRPGPHYWPRLFYKMRERPEWPCLLHFSLNLHNGTISPMKRSTFPTGPLWKQQLGMSQTCSGVLPQLQGFWQAQPDLQSRALSLSLKWGNDFPLCLNQRVHSFPRPGGNYLLKSRKSQRELTPTLTTSILEPNNGRVGRGNTSQKGLAISSLLQSMNHLSVWSGQQPVSDWLLHWVGTPLSWGWEETLFMESPAPWCRGRHLGVLRVRPIPLQHKGESLLN